MGNARWTGVRLRDVLDRPDDLFWTKTACRIPDTPNADVRPGETGFATVPISRMNPRSRVTNLRAGRTVPPDAPLAVRGIALGGDAGMARVDISPDGSASWQPATLGADEGRCSFRRREGDPARPVRSIPRAGARPRRRRGPRHGPSDGPGRRPRPDGFPPRKRGASGRRPSLPRRRPAGATDANCVTCHSAGMVLNQPPLRRAEWTAEVGRVARVCKAPVSPGDQAAIIDDLAATKGRS